MVLYQKKLFVARDFVHDEFSVSWMDQVNGAVESLLDLDSGVDQVVAAGGRFELEDAAGEADGVVVGDGPLMLSAEDGRQMQRRIDAAPGGRGVGRGPAKRRQNRGIKTWLR